jgi:predicted nucleotidyltransferase
MLWELFFKPKKSPEQDLKRLTESLKIALGDHLSAIVLFGSMAGSEFHPEHSDVNVLIVADQSFDTLQQMRSALNAWLKKGHVLPVLVDRREIHRFARSFPIEFLDMQSQHRVLHGEDPLNGLTVDLTLLRAQCEHDLTLNELKLRQAFAAAGTDDKKIRSILVDSLPSILTLFRAVLHLEKSSPVPDKLDAAKKLGERIGFDSAILQRLHTLRFRRSTDHVNDLATHYLLIIEKVIKSLNPL